MYSRSWLVTKISLRLSLKQVPFFLDISADDTFPFQVADFAGASVNILDRTLSTDYQDVRSSCEPSCSVCANNAMNFTYIAGDIMLGGELFLIWKTIKNTFSHH